MALWGFGFVVLACFYVVVDGDLLGEDGVRVTNEGDLRVMSAVWQLITIMDPPLEPPMLPWLHFLRNTLSNSNFTGQLMEKVHWYHRLSKLEHQMRQDSPVVNKIGDSRPYGLKRHRRGLLNVVGSGLSWLFGLATGDQLEEMKLAMSKNSKDGDILYHNEKEMLSIMNDTRKIQRHMTQSIAHYRSVVAAEIRRLKIEIVGVEQWERTRSALMHGFEEIDKAMDCYEKALAGYNQRLMQVERGFLTEDLLPKERLRELLGRLRSNGFATLPEHWYYSYATVHPIWSVDDKIAYSTFIPLVRSVKYIQYGLLYMPVGLGKNHLRQLVGRHNIAVRTEDTGSFVPSDCRGEAPIVCMPAREDIISGCEAALATGGNPSNCEIKIVKKGNRDATVIPPKGMASVVLVAPHRSSISAQILCRGKAPVRLSIDKPQAIHLEKHCTLRGEGWRVDSIQWAKETIVIRGRKPELVLAGLNVSWPKIINEEFNNNDFGLSEIKIPLIDVDRLRPLSVHAGIRKLAGWWKAIIVVMVVLVVVGLVVVGRGRVVVLRGLLQKKARKRKFNEGKEEELELSSLGEAQPKRARLDKSALSEMAVSEAREMGSRRSIECSKGETSKELLTAYPTVPESCRGEGDLVGRAEKTGP